MARRHGWQLPAHTFQVVAITVFFLLSVAFYAFFAPFLGKDIYEYIAIGIYSFLALCVFILYVRCTAIDPADPGILIEPDETLTHRLQNNSELPEEPSKIGLNNRGKSEQYSSSCCSTLGFLVKADCLKDEDHLQEPNGEEEALFCTLCNAEVRKFSKHCRSCDKCVDGFDHHCRVGLKLEFITLLESMFLFCWADILSGVFQSIDEKGTDCMMCGAIRGSVIREIYDLSS